MEFLFNIPYLVPILVVVGVFVLYTQLASRLSIRLPQLPTNPEDLLGKLLGPSYAAAKLEKTIAREKKMGNYLNAGRLYEEADKPLKAVEAYVEGNEHFAAASLLEKLGKLERAAELYMQAGDPKKAAQVFATAGKPGKAAALFLEKGNTLEAARLFGVAQEWGKAADLYARGGYPLRAAEAYEKAGDLAKAAECHERHFMENVSFSTSYAATGPSADQKSALLAGRLYEKAGDQNRAFQIYAKGGYFKEAGTISLRLGQHAKAAELFLRAEDPESAAHAFEQAGDKVKAANLRGEVALKRDQVPEAARFFQEGEDYLRAAELFESVGLLPEAAGAYEAGDSHAAAGSVYIRANLKDRAAASFEKAGEFETAAKLYEEVGQGNKAIELYGRAGQTFKSGEAAARAGDRDKAIALLQRVAHDDENYRPATELLARMFIESRMPGLAVERVLKVLGGQAVSPGTLDLYYWLAAGHEASGNLPEALGIYKKILSEDLSFRDVERRVAHLQLGGTPLAPAGPPVAAAPAPTPAPSPAPPAPPPPAVVPAPPASAPPAVAAPRPAAPKSPRLVPKEELGRGPLGAVFRAEDQVDGRSVALRMLPPELIAGGMLKDLAHDLKAAAQLSHPNLVKVLGLVEVSGQRCVVSEYVQGRTFAEALKLGHKMTFQQAHGLGRVLAQTLEFVHGKGLVHGSLQPSNVMVAAGVVKLADLGLARLAAVVPRQLDYAAPEKQADVAGDIFAMAAVLYHLLTGVHPRSQAQGVALPLPSTLATGVPEAFDKLLIRCLHPRVDLRLPTAADVLRELKDMVKIG